MLRADLARFSHSFMSELRALLPPEDSIDLAQGIPAAVSTSFILQAATTAILQGHNQYTSSRGHPDLRRAIAHHVEDFQGLHYDPTEEIVVTTGASEGLYATLLAILEPGQEVVYFTPCYEAYPALISAAGVRGRPVALKPPNWRLSLEELKKVCSPRTRALLLNDPHNPTGRVLSREELTPLAELCCQEDLIAITDQVYEHFVYDGTFLPLATLEGMRERTISVSSTGKTFGLTGWKIGYVCSSKTLAQAVRTVHKYIVLSSGTPLQLAMARGLERGKRLIKETCARQRRRRDLALNGLRSLGFTAAPAQGGLFLVADVRSVGFQTSAHFCRWLAKSAGVLSRPVAQAGYPKQSYEESLVRVAFCKNEKTLLKALERIGRAIDKR